MFQLASTCVLLTAAAALPTSTPDMTVARRSEPIPGPGGGFHTEGKPAVDDLFGDASDYRRLVDRFVELAGQMQTMRDDFARTVQVALEQLGVRGSGARRVQGCPAAQVAGPYARAHRLGAEYLRIGRELTRLYEQVREYDRLGESIGLTPDYRWKVKKVLQQYNTLLTDYREMKIAFHDQLVDELSYAGCDLQALLLRGDPQAKGPVDPTWPPPGQPGAPGVQLAKGDPPRDAAHDARDSGHDAMRDLPALGGVAERPTATGVSSLGPTGLAPPVDSSSDAQRSGVLFYVDNSRCARATTVFIDGKRLGAAPAGTRVGFQTAPGPHDLCLLEEGSRTDCGQRSNVRRSYLHEGWTISLRCE